MVRAMTRARAPKLARPEKRPARIPRRDFADLVQTAASSTKPLPLTHMTDAYLFRSIMETETLEPVPCRVFENEPLLYFFYGRPAYRAAVQSQSNGLDAYAPICIVLKPDAASPRRIYPFDSGAFHKRLFADFTHHRMEKEDFELGNSMEMPGRLINLFWKGEQSYYNNRNTSDFVPAHMAFEAQSYQELIRYRAKGPFDDRASAIEIQAADEIALPDNIVAVIMPSDYMKGPIASRIEEMGGLALPYDHVSRGVPGENVGQIYNIVRELLSGRHGKVRYW
ncbi:hypothetical protein SAMN05518668_11624 [Sphingobium sp. YR657]|nr:hypothetical protein SAMN05518668_11624 [Sphingobium sp. YR657]